MRRLRRWRYVGMLAGSGVLLQTAGCNLDAATMESLTTAIVQIVVQALMSSLGGTGTFPTV
ncbi:MAG: hypothetical protein AB1716_12695 [Planctomycetota bacterium]